MAWTRRKYLSWNLPRKSKAGLFFAPKTASGFWCKKKSPASDLRGKFKLRYFLLVEAIWRVFDHFTTLSKLCNVQRTNLSGRNVAGNQIGAFNINLNSTKFSATQFDWLANLSNSHHIVHILQTWSRMLFMFNLLPLRSFDRVIEWSVTYGYGSAYKRSLIRVIQVSVIQFSVFQSSGFSHSLNLTEKLIWRSISLSLSHINNRFCF